MSPSITRNSIGHARGVDLGTAGAATLDEAIDDLVDRFCLAFNRKVDDPEVKGLVESAVSAEITRRAIDYVTDLSEGRDPIAVNDLADHLSRKLGPRPLSLAATGGR